MKRRRDFAGEVVEADVEDEEVGEPETDVGRNLAVEVV